MKTELKQINGQLVTGHVSRDGKFVDVRPVVVTARCYQSVVTLETYKRDVSVTLQTQTPLAEPLPCWLQKSWGNSYSVSSHAITPGRVTLGEISIPFEIKNPPEIITEAEYAVHRLALAERQKAAVIAAQDEEWQRHVENIAAIPAAAAQWLKSSPKEARRFSSGRIINPPWKTIGIALLGADFAKERLLLPLLRKELSRILSAAATERKNNSLSK